MQYRFVEKWNKRDLIYFTFALLCLTPLISSPIALVLGFLLVSFGLVPTQLNVNKITKKLLSYSIIGLGFGINLDQAVDASRGAIGLIITSIFCTLLLGWIFTRLLKIDHKTGHLIASGTAICGGSAIAAVAPAIDATEEQTSLALATVFVLNSIALFVFPVIGHLLAMSQHAFGMWCAIAIHDTSSVVGAASSYGEEALITATTLKLARALWIIPVALLSAFLFKGKSKKITVPLFIVFYCLAIVFTHYVPAFTDLYQTIFSASKQTLVLCLFLIGSGITLGKIKDAGMKPLLLGVLLWVIISSSTLFYIEAIL